MSALIISPILNYALKNWASDIHICEWNPLTFRIHWHLITKTESWVIDSTKIKGILSELENNNNKAVDFFLEWHDADFAYIHEDWTSFRVNAFYKRWKMAFVLRVISSKVTPLESLWLPNSVSKITSLKQWLVLITWPTGSWKSTTMVAILDYINKNRSEHILTIEDPVEYIFTNDKSIFSQREVLHDTNSFSSALRAAMREDPDIIMIWEMRDKETVKAAIELAETWHLVISTLHTSSAVQTITRLLSFFPSDLQNSMRAKLSDTLMWVISQRLIPKANEVWRIWIFELMFMTVWIKNLIRSWDLNQIQGSIETGMKNWMIEMKKYADNLEEKWLVKKEDYMDYFKEDNVGF